MGLAIRLHSSILRYGITDITSSEHISLFNETNIKLVPSSALYYGTKCAFNAFNMLSDTSCFIISDRYE